MYHSCKHFSIHQRLCKMQHMYTNDVSLHRYSNCIFSRLLRLYDIQRWKMSYRLHVVSMGLLFPILVLKPYLDTKRTDRIHAEMHFTDSVTTLLAVTSSTSHRNIVATCKSFSFICHCCQKQTTLPCLPRFGNIFGITMGVDFKKGWIQAWHVIASNK